jgi:toxin ParE1/3/4
MNEFRVAPAALQELNEAIDWYGARSQRAAQRFAQAIDSALTQIESTPLRFPQLNEQYRYVQLRQFPYFIAYRVDGNVITVGSIRHTSRGTAEFAPQSPS